MNIQDNLNTAIGLGAMLARGTVEYKTQEKVKDAEANENKEAIMRERNLNEARSNFDISRGVVENKFKPNKNGTVNYRARLTGVDNIAAGESYVDAANRYRDLLRQSAELDPKFTNDLKVLESQLGPGSAYEEIQRGLPQGRITARKQQAAREARKAAQVSLEMAAEEVTSSRTVVDERRKILEGGNN